jgi:hypothetical protein
MTKVKCPVCDFHAIRHTLVMIHYVDNHSHRVFENVFQKSLKDKAPPSKLLAKNKNEEGVV